MINRNAISGIILFAIFSLMMVSVVSAGDVDRIGTASGVQVLVPTSPRGFATVGSDLALTSGIHAINYNPAGLSRMENKAVGQFSQLTIFNDIKVNYGALAASMGSLGKLAFSIKTFDFGDIPVTTREDSDGESGTTFSPTFATTMITYSNRLTSKISVGLNTKFIYESIPSASASAFAFDIGLQYDGLAGIAPLSFGINIKNIGSSMRYSGSGLTSEYTDEATGRQDFLKREAAKSDLPAAFEIGLGYKVAINEQNNMVVSSTFRNNNYGYDNVLLGLEYSFQNMIFVRGGYNYEVDINASDQLYTFALGAGFEYQLGNANVAIDYAFRNSKYFDGNNLFGITIGF